VVPTRVGRYGIIVGMESQTWIGETSHGMVVVRWVDGRLVLDQPTAARFRTPLTQVAEFPTDFAGRAGWYESGGERVLLTHFPDSYFGEPMLVACTGDRVVRLYPVGEDVLRGEDGSRFDLSSLERSPAYVEHDLGTGTLIRLATPGPHPVAILAHGAATRQRDINRLFAQPFLDAGVGVYIYDKDTGADIFTNAGTISASMDLLAALPGVDGTRIGLFGFSNSMWSVPMVATRRGDVAFIAGIGSPGVSQAGSETHRRTKILREAGVSEPSVAAVGQAWRLIFAVAGAGTAAAEQAEELQGVLAEVGRLPDLSRYEPPDYVRNNPMLSPIPPSPAAAAEMLASLGGDGDPELLYDPAADLARVTCPVFLQYGEFDTSVPVAASVERVAAALAKAGVPHNIKVYPGLEHMLNVIPAGIPASLLETSIHGFHRFSFGAGVRADLRDWLVKLHSRPKA